MLHRSRPLAALVLLSLVGFAGEAARAQYGRGLPSYRVRGKSAYQFGYRTEYDVVVVNAALRDVEFRLSRIKNLRGRFVEPASGWIVPAGSVVRLGVTAYQVEGYFKTRENVQVEVEPLLGPRYATFVLYEGDVLFYARDVGSRAVQLLPEGTANELRTKGKIERATVWSSKLKRIVRGLQLVKDAKLVLGDQPLPTIDQGSWPEERLDAGDQNDIPVDQQISSAGRQRRSGETLIRVNVTHTDGTTPTGRNYRARIGHGLAHRTAAGTVGANGQIRFYTSRAENLDIDVEILGDRRRVIGSFTVEPADRNLFDIQIP